MLQSELLPPPTVCVFDRTYAPTPGMCDFAWVGASLAPCLQAMDVDSQTQSSDHQPLWLALG